MNYPVLYQWQEEIASQLSSLNSWQVANVALFSKGVMKAQDSQLRTIARQIVSDEKEDSAVKRLGRFVANEKVNLTAVFGEWTAWVLAGMPHEEVAILVDETKVEDRFGVMMAGIPWQSRFIPLAWRCYRANDREAYPEEGQVRMIAALLEAIKAGIPADCEVTVMVDAGIGTSSAMCQAILDLDWHYLFRVTRNTKMATETGTLKIADMVEPGTQWSAAGKLFASRGQLPGYAHAIWDEGYEKPWVLITSKPAATGRAYGQRNWQEQGHRDFKSGGWHWEGSHIRKPQHMARLILLLAIAYTWTIAMGGVAIKEGSAHPLTRTADGSLRRHWSLFKEGLQYFVEEVLRHARFVPLQFFPDTRFT